MEIFTRRMEQKICLKKFEQKLNEVEKMAQIRNEGYASDREMKRQAKINVEQKMEKRKMAVKINVK
jgi:hypothetical protein